MKLRIAERARRQIVAMDEWWAAHRPAAASLFLDELHDTLRLICESPGVGTAWPTARHPDLRRVVMIRTRNHVYYRVHGDSIRVLAVWGAPKRRAPRL